jgi:hypothetical protein
MVLAATLGSFAALKSSPFDSPYDITEDVSRVRIAIGGFLVIFGARLADGCTSGHGITGMGHLALRSMVAVSGCAELPAPQTAVLAHVTPCLTLCLGYYERHVVHIPCSTPPSALGVFRLPSVAHLSV